MPNLRLFLWLALLFLVWLNVDAWMKFYGRAPAPATAPAATPAGATPPASSLTEALPNAQLAGISEVRPGAHWNRPHDATVRVITEGLRDPGLLDGEPGELVERDAYKAFYAHRAGHWLGMDVHDVGEYNVGEEWRLLEPGMVMTVAPGIYIAPGTKGVAKEWQGIGIRIEDDVAVTDRDPEVLTSDVPRDADEIERLAQSA